MFFRAINMLRSLGSSEFNVDEEKEGCRSDLSLNDSSPEAIEIHDNSTDDMGVDKINNSDVFRLGFNRNIQPRASIRTQGLDQIDLNSKSTPKISNEFVKGQTYPVLASESKANDDDIIIIKEIPSQNEVTRSKRSLHIAKSKYCKNELLCVDDDLPSPLVIDLGDVVTTEEKHSSDSQSSYYTSPQEIFDLCDNEIRTCKADELGQNEGGFKDLCEAVTAASPQQLKTDISLPSKLQDNIEPPDIDVEKVMKAPTTKNNMFKSSENIRERVKNVKDSIVRLKLPIKGTKKKKLFIIQTSKLIGFVQCKRHPLYKWQHLLTLENINDLPQDEKMKMIKILADFIEVKVVKTKRKHAAA